MRPQIPTSVVAHSVLVMFLARLGSLHSMEQLKNSKLLQELVGGRLPSADSIGRIMNLVDPTTLRGILNGMHRSLKANKVLQPPDHGFIALVLDGHESHSSYRRQCDGCLVRRKVIGGNEVTQYYHRNVTAQLVFKDLTFLLDAERQLPGEGELSCALRLLDRVLSSYAKSFHVVVMDALYAKSTIFNKILKHKKEAIAVLKDDRRDLLFAAESAFEKRSADVTFNLSGTQFSCWEHADSESWNQVNKCVRVIRSIETKMPVQKQLSGKSQSPADSSWTWVTTLSRERAGIKAIVELGHSRWSIENQGFNELVNHWHADHVYRHASSAIPNFWLMAMIAYNLFRTFFLRNLKATMRKGKTMLHFARLIASALFYSYSPTGVPP
jgi:hypothetical protein